MSSSSRPSTASPQPSAHPSDAVRAELPPMEMPIRATLNERNMLRRPSVARVVEMLREHPVFEMPNLSDGEGLREHFSPLDRERAWTRETLRLFEQRIALITTLALALLPVFWLVYAFYSPQTRVITTLFYALLGISCVMVRIQSRRTASLSWMRLFVVVLYALFALTATWVMSAAHSPVVSAFSGHPQILVSLLFMPLSLGEVSLCAFWVVTTFGLSLANATGATYETNLTAVLMRTASLGLTACLIVAMSHLSCLMRRNAFDNAFEMAHSASHSAALSNLDAVTGGFNRRHLMNMLELELSRATRFEQPLSFLMFDIDNFKQVNDTHGHPAGDAVLREVMTATAGAVRGIDTAARYGGDEFAIILPGTSLADAIATAERLKEQVYTRLREVCEPNSAQSQVELSLGVTCIPPGQEIGADETIARADVQLYAAKRAGKNTICGG